MTPPPPPPPFVPGPGGSAGDYRNVPPPKTGITGIIKEREGEEEERIIKDSGLQSAAEEASTWRDANFDSIANEKINQIKTNAIGEIKKFNIT